MIEFIPKLRVKVDKRIDIFIGMHIDKIKEFIGSLWKERYIEKIFPDKIYKEKTIYYNIANLIFKNDILEGIEFSPDIKVIYNDIDLSNENYKETISKITAMGYKYNFRDDGYEFNDINLCIYAPAGELESISIYRDNYFDDMYKNLMDFKTEIKKENGIEKRIYTPKI